MRENGAPAPSGTLEQLHRRRRARTHETAAAPSAEPLELRPFVSRGVRPEHTRAALKWVYAGQYSRTL